MRFCSPRKNEAAEDRTRRKNISSENQQNVVIMRANALPSFTSDPDLSLIVLHWQILELAIKPAIVAMVRTTFEQENNFSRI